MATNLSLSISIYLYISNSLVRYFWATIIVIRDTWALKQQHELNIMCMNSFDTQNKPQKQTQNDNHHQP